MSLKDFSCADCFIFIMNTVSGQAQTIKCKLAVGIEVTL